MQVGDFFQLGPAGFSRIYVFMPCMFTSQDFGSKGAAGVLSVRRYQEPSPCRKIPHTSKKAPMLAKGEPISELGATNFARICCAHDSNCQVVSLSLTQPTRFLSYFVPSV